MSEDGGMDEALSPREHGLRLGREYALRSIDDRAKLRRVIRARNAEEVRAEIDWMLLESVDPEAPVAFWSGFAHGVRTVLVDEAAALSRPLPPSRPEPSSA